jgi:hypothetical protein
VAVFLWGWGGELLGDEVDGRHIMANTARPGRTSAYRTFLFRV